MKRRIGLIFIVIISSFLKSAAQNQWILSGSGYGIDFTTNSPTFFYHGIGKDIRVPLSMAVDSVGDILFYSDGVHFWNRNNQLLTEYNLSINSPPFYSTIISDYEMKNKFYQFVLQTGDGNYLNTIIFEDGKIDIKSSELLIKSKFGGGVVPFTICQSMVAIEGPIMKDGGFYANLYSFSDEENRIEVSEKLLGARNNEWPASFSNKVSPRGTHWAFITKDIKTSEYFLNIYKINFTTKSINSGAKTKIGLDNKTGGAFNINNGFEFSIDGNYIYCASVAVEDKINIIQFDLNLNPIDSVEIGYISTSVNRVSDMKLTPKGEILINKRLWFDDTPWFAKIPHPNNRGFENNFIGKGLALPEDLYEGQLYFPVFPSNNLFYDKNYETIPDTTICSGETIKLGPNPQNHLTYDWSPKTNLDFADIANPDFSLENTTGDTLEIKYKLIVTDSLCPRENTLVVKVKPSPKAEIIGKDSVCPGVEGHEYKFQEVEGYKYSWQINGGEIISGADSSTVTTKWYQPNFDASIKISAISGDECNDVVAQLPIRVNYELKTETPKGAALICTNDLMDQSYQVTDTKASTYSWGLNEGLLRDDYTSAITVDWTGKDGMKIWVNEMSITSDTVCYGVSDTLFVKVNPDTMTININSVSVNKETNASVDILWSPSNRFELKEGVLLRKRNFGEISWEDQIEIPQTGNWHDENVDVNSQAYEYQIIGESICESEKQSRIHNTILLEHDEELTEHEMELFFNDYKGWPKGVVQYEIFNKLPDGENTKVDDLSPNNNIYLITNSPEKDHNYVVKAISKDGKESWSNSISLTFKNTLFVPNVITSNGDGFNDTFKIKNLEYYPENYLKIFNRLGREIFSQKNYKENWPSESIQSGTYYYQLDIFGGKASSLKGWVYSINN